jgi:sorbitol-specific phosphotransferase system component IIBC
MDYIPPDMTPVAHKKHIEYIRSLTGEQRALIAFEMSDKARQELIDDIKKQHPEFTKQQLIIEIIRRCYGEKLAQEVAAAKGWK